LDVRILGPIEVWDGAAQCRLGGAKPRALLVDLALHANEVVSTDRLIDDLWGESSADTSRTALRVLVARLRKVLPSDVLVTRSPGYLLRLEPDQLDLHRFEQLVVDARRALADGEPAEAADGLRAALAMWRGPPLVDVAYEDFAQAAIARLEEVRLASLELRIEVDLALGRHRDLVGELEALVVEHQLRERLRGHLMLALYRSGRQAEALRAYQDARRVLQEQIGIDPSPTIARLEVAILQQDPSLDLAAEEPAIVSGEKERAILVEMAREDDDHPLVELAEPLARHPPRVIVLAQVVADAAALASASSRLEVLRSDLTARGVVARAVTFTSTVPGRELARLASELDVDLLLAETPDGLLADGIPDDELASVLARTPCDVALLVPRDAVPGRPVLVPFGGAEHDWAAVELGAWLARSNGVQLRLAGAAAVPERGRRDASRLLAHGSLAVQRVLGIPTGPDVRRPGPTTPTGRWHS
jgi:DNA-binding SARP family transcriptional activator